MNDERNFYDPPFVSMIDSGTFWRCPHGKTRWARFVLGRLGL